MSATQTLVQKPPMTNDMANLTEPISTTTPSTSDIEKKNEEDFEDLFTDKHTALVQYEKYCHLKARVSDYIDLFNKRFAIERDVDYDDLYEDLSMEREFAINKLDRKWGSDEVLFTELRQLPLHKKIIEYYKEYELDFFEVEDIQQLRNYMKISNVKYLEPSEVQEQIKRDILQCAFERGDSYVIRDVKPKLLQVLEVFDKIKW